MAASRQGYHNAFRACAAGRGGGGGLLPSEPCLDASAAGDSGTGAGEQEYLQAAREVVEDLVGSVKQGILCPTFAWGPWLV